MATRRTSSVWITSQNDMVCSKRVCARVCTCVRFHGADGRVCVQSIGGCVFAGRKWVRMAVVSRCMSARIGVHGVKACSS
jgi:hypothetical protein